MTFIARAREATAVNHPQCSGCRNADRTARYSNWNYCTDPKDSREMTIIRRRDDFTGKLYLPMVPDFCPHHPANQKEKVFK